ncbi:MULTISPECIES: hypothetical protein [Clostridium]|uniref:hypothetical protein n=1 Tax=Clostridium TaxID=1485 RepID=UPI000824F501|nr:MULTISPECIES: hypothetical protein [Clostridium]PJI09953.1 hypothetical protein CUB90_19680 [Clostridium sp. CT7]
MEMKLIEVNEERKQEVFKIIDLNSNISKVTFNYVGTEKQLDNFFQTACLGYLRRNKLID